MGDHTDADNRPRSWWFLDTYVVEHPATGGLRVLDMTLPPGAAPPEHAHHSYDDSFFVLEGELLVRIAGAVRIARPGDWVSTPKGTPHAFRVIGSQPARMLIVLDHPSFVELIHAIGEPAAASALPPPSRSPGADEVFRAFATHDVDVTGLSITDDEAEYLGLAASLGPAAG
jgi:quercetin dioxygenase-like cupin family protein